MDLRIDEENETGALTATYVRSRSGGNGRVDIIVSFVTGRATERITKITLADVG